MNSRENDKIIQKEFGRNLCAERNRLGLSQEGLGRLVNKEGTYIGRIERGEINPTLSTIVNLLKALNLPFEKLTNYKNY